MTRTVLRNGWILDGTGNPWMHGDLAISGEKIAAVGAVEPREGDLELDVQGHIVCPGFIDIHTHSDASYIADSAAASQVCQGVTTDVVGNCGMSCAPLRGPGGQAFFQTNRRLFGDDPTVKQETMDGFLSQLDKNGLPLNVAAMVGHSALRASVMGYATRRPSVDEQSNMNRVLEESLEEGAFGLTLGYKPGDQADEDELVALGRVVAKHRGFIADHSVPLSVNKGGGDDSTLYEASTSVLRRLMNVGQRAQVPVQASHAKAIGPALWGRACWITDIIDRARAEGVEATCDLYGYTTGGGGLVGLFAPQFLLEQADYENLPASIREAVADPAMRERVLTSISRSFNRLGGADKVRVADFEPEREVERLTFWDLSQARGRPAAEIALDFLERGDAHLRCEVMAEKDVMHLMRHPSAMICSDAKAVAIEGPEERERVHPRTFGAFPRILRRYVIEFGVMGLEEAVRKMTLAPARRLGLNNRGWIEEGCYADLVVFNPEEVGDLANYEDPYRPPKGIRYVFVNGKLAMREGEFQRCLAGKALRKE